MSRYFVSIVSYISPICDVSVQFVQTSVFHCQHSHHLPIRNNFLPLDSHNLQRFWSTQQPMVCHFWTMWLELWGGSRQNIWWRRSRCYWRPSYRSWWLREDRFLRRWKKRVDLNIYMCAPVKWFEIENRTLHRNITFENLFLLLICKIINYILLF